MSTNRSLMLKLDKVEARSLPYGDRPYVSGGRSLARQPGKDGGGKRRKMKAKWHCIGCENQHSGQKCRRREYKITLNVAAGYLREGGFTAGELGEKV